MSKKFGEFSFSAPQTISWDITNKCNFNCVHCYNRSGDNLSYDFNTELNFDETMNCVQQIIDLKPETVCLCGGEPTLNPFFFNILTEFSKKNIRVNMVSNGSLITEAFAKKLKKFGIRLVQISLDSHISIEHNEFRQHKNAYELAVEAIKNLKKEKLYVCTSMCPTKFNVFSLDDYIQFVSNLGVDMIRIMPLLPMGRGYDNFLKICPSNEEYFVLKSSIFKAKSRGVNIEWGDPLDHIRKATEFERDFPIGIDIKANGNIGVSAYLPIIVGNVKRYKLKEYWKNGLNKIWGNKIIYELAEQIYTLHDFNKMSKDRWSESKKEFDLIDDKVK